MAKIHDNLKHLRQDRGWTQEEVSRRMALTRQAVSSHESGRTQPDLEMLKRYAEIYQVTVQDILYGTDRSRHQQRRIQCLAMLALVDLVGCTFLHSVLLWISNRYFSVPEGQVAPEMLPALQRHLAISQSAQGVEGFCLVSFGALALLLTVLVTRLEPPLSWKRQLAYLAALAAGAWIALLPWAVSDPVFGLANYASTPTLQLLWAGVLLLLSLLTGRFHRPPKA